MWQRSRVSYSWRTWFADLVTESRRAACASLVEVRLADVCGECGELASETFVGGATACALNRLTAVCSRALLINMQMFVGKVRMDKDGFHTASVDCGRFSGEALREWAG